MKKDMEDELKLHVSLHKCKRATRIVIEEMKGKYRDELEAYCMRLNLLT